MKFQKLGVTIKSIDDSTYTLRATFSTSDVDRHGEIVDNKSWNLKDYNENPVLLFSHDHNQPPVGRIKNLSVRNGVLEGDVEFAAEQYEFANTLWKLYRDGFMRAFSVGFSSGLTDMVNGKRVLKDNSLFEISTVSVPANAMALAKHKGIDVTALENKYVEMDDSEDKANGHGGRREGAGRPAGGGSGGSGTGSTGKGVQAKHKDFIESTVTNDSPFSQADLGEAKLEDKIDELTEKYGNPISSGIGEYWAKENSDSTIDIMGIEVMDGDAVFSQWTNMTVSSEKELSKSNDCPGCAPHVIAPETPVEDVPETVEEKAALMDAVTDIAERNTKTEKFREVEEMFWAFYSVYFDGATDVEAFDELLSEFISLIQGEGIEKSMLNEVLAEDITISKMEYLKGGPGSGGAREGAGRPPGSGSSGGGGGKKPADDKKPASSGGSGSTGTGVQSNLTDDDVHDTLNGENYKTRVLNKSKYDEENAAMTEKYGKPLEISDYGADNKVWVSQDAKGNATFMMTGTVDAADSDTGEQTYWKGTATNWTMPTSAKSFPITVNPPAISGFKKKSRNRDINKAVRSLLQLKK